MILSKSIITLVRKGRYSLQTPDGQSPTLLTIFYLDGDVLVYSDEFKLGENQEVCEAHFKKLDAFLTQIKRQLRRLEITIAAGLFGFSWLGLALADLDQYIALALSALVGAVAWYARRLIGRGVIRLVYRGYLKMGKRIVFNKDLFRRSKKDDE